MNNELVLTSPEPRAITPMDLFQQMVDKVEGIDPNAFAAAIQTLAALRDKERDYHARVGFDDALNDCQKQIGRIAPNQKRENGIMWADYAQLDRTLRPIYTGAGFSVAFSEDSTANGRMRMKGTLSRGGISKDYFAEISTAPANSKMNQLDADASASSRVKRYLLLAIFNIAVGIDKAEKTPYEQVELMDEDEVQSYVDALNNAPDLNALKAVFGQCYGKAKSMKDEPAKKRFTSVYEALKKEFMEGSR